MSSGHYRATHSLVDTLSNADRLGLAYLQAIPPDERRGSGQVYTPPHLVQFVLELSGFFMEETPEATLLDPACGAGAFLRGAVFRLAHGLVIEGLDLATPHGHSSLLRRIESTIFGMDIDASACALARTAVREAVLQLSPGWLPEQFFEANVVVGDFLLGPGGEKLAPAANGGFSYVVGNPPYVGATRIDPAYKASLRLRYQTATGRLDLYTLFMERAVDLLQAGGKLAFITPNKYLMSQSAAPLRGLLSRTGALVKLASFRSHKVFEGAATVPCVTVFEKGRSGTDTEVLECGERPSAEGKIPVFKRTVLHAPRGKGPWHVGSPALLGLAERIKGRHLPLAAFASRISAGIATGLDEVFVRPKAQLDIETELIVPVARGRDLGAFRVDYGELAMLLPYRFSHGQAELIQLDDYPRAKRFLAPHAEALRNRHCVRVWQKAWWDVHDPVGWDLARMEKILVPDVAASNRFAVDGGRVYPLHSAYYILPKGVDSGYLAGVLNSKPIEFLVRLLAPVVKDGFSRYRKQFLAQLPVPRGDGDVHRRMAAAASSADQAAVDAIAAELFQLEPTDLREMEAFLKERSAAHIGASGRET